MKVWKKIILSLGVIMLFVWLVTLKAGPKAKVVDYGATFSVPYAQGLGIDWKDAYKEAIIDLQIKKMRIPVYWDEVENNRDTYNWDDFDYMLNLAKDNNVQVVFAIGKRLPRWPECHVPGWAEKLSSVDEQNAQLSYMETVVRKYGSNASIIAWQVENEAFLGSFGPCPKLDTAFFDKEINLVKTLDPSRPILTTDSGELNWWIKASSRGDEFGTTYYRYVYSDVLKRYWTNFYFPSWFYLFKGGIVRILHPGKPVYIAELEAEPWTTAGIPNTPIDQQFQTMSLDKFNTITRLAAETGYSPQYLWGVEWWYWMKQHGHPEFWERAKQLIHHTK